MPVHGREEANEEVTFDAALTNLSSLLRKRQKSLDEREEELKKASDKLEQEKASFGSGEASDVIHLNVGGTLMATLRSTLTYAEDSVLATRFSGRWDDALAKDKYGNFFIDQPFELFQPMIDFIRSKQNHKNASASAPQPPGLSDFGNNQRKYDDFKLMVKYFGVTSVIFPSEPDSAQPDEVVSGQRNHQAAARASSSGHYVGVCRLPSGKWQSSFRFARKQRYVGSFKTRDEAALSLKIVEEKLKNAPENLAEGLAKTLFDTARKTAHEEVANYKE